MKINVDIDQELWDRFQSICNEKGVTTAGEIADLIVSRVVSYDDFKDDTGGDA